MLKLNLQNTAGSPLVERSILGNLRTCGACYTKEFQSVETHGISNPNFCTPHHPILDTLDLSFNCLSLELSKAVSDAFRANPSFKYINLDSSNVKERADIFFPLLETPNLLLYSLNLNQCKLGAPGISQLVNCLQNMSQPLVELSISGNNITPDICHTLSPYLAANRSLLLLDISLNPITKFGVSILSRALAQAGHPLKTLSLKGIGLDDSAKPELEEFFFHEDFKVEFLDLSWNTVGPECEGEVPSIFGKLKTVKELSINMVKPGPKGFPRMFDSFKGNSTLEIIHTCSNYIPPEEAHHLADTITCLPLKWLDLVSTFLVPGLLGPILPAIASHQTLRILTLCNGTLKDEGAQMVASLIAQNTGILELHITVNEIGDIGTASIANALLSNTNLRNLRMSENQIGEQGAQLLIDALKSNSTLQYLDISENDFDPEMFEGIEFPNAPNRTLVLHSAM